MSCTTSISLQEVELRSNPSSRLKLLPGRLAPPRRYFRCCFVKTLNMFFITCEFPFPHPAVWLAEDSGTTDLAEPLERGLPRQRGTIQTPSSVRSGRRRGRPRRPPTPPGIRFRTKAVPAKPLCFCLIACPPISAQPYLTDSVRYLQL